LITRIPATNSQSGNVVSYGWGQLDGVNILAIEFRGKGGNRVYHYLGVPGPIWEALKTAPSAGIFINERIKPGWSAVRVQ